MKVPEDNLPKVLDELVAETYRIVRDDRGNFRAEDLISASAAFTGECVMRHAGDFDFEHHTLAPGQPVFSQKVTELLSGDRAIWTEIPKDSVFGAMRNLLANHPNRPWPTESFPDVAKIYQRFAAARRGGVTKEDWGKAPLSVPASHRPSEEIPPLRAAFALRAFTYGKWGDEKLTSHAVMTMAQLSQIMILTQIRPSIEPNVALLLAFETVNAMAKTAPALPKHMKEFMREQGVSHARPL
ncbi:MAG TPA: hypothetical protein VH206_09605 [Xanthobacteraceae bacterium]|jgi:hypothetical protein|nr:hypothetical protein [Xanthobacteraceae bacterium]